MKEHVLPDVEPRLFKHIRDWIYTGVLNRSNVPSDCDLCLLWIVADMLLMSTLQNCVMTMLVTKGSKHALELKGSIGQICDNISTDGKLYKFLVASYGRLTEACMSSIKAQCLPAELLTDILGHVREIGLEEAQWRLLDACKFHEHPAETVSGNGVGVGGPGLGSTQPARPTATLVFNASRPRAQQGGLFRQA